MRRSIIAILAASIASTVCIAADGEASDLPLRKAGLWELRTETSEGNGTQTQQLTMCIGEQMERETVRTSGMENRANCAKYDVEKVGDKTIVDARCVYDDRKVVTRTELEGDFTTSFRAKVTSSTDGTAPKHRGGHPVNVRRTIHQEGKYLGESCGNLKAGEAKTTDGRTVTVVQ